ncbi:MAG: indole-3-glycerol phosphate synthase TrpC [Acidimicrobiales bacterium]
MPAFLPDIVAAHRRMAAGDLRDPQELLARALELPPARPFADALLAGAPPETGAGAGAPDQHGLAVIAEVKRRSPSRGLLAPDLDPAGVAREYSRGGAACLSVLTDEQYFGGSAADLVAARDASGLPVLRKDFTIGPRDVCDARLMGADAVLLIVAALSDHELEALHGLAGRVGLEALVEVHDEAELERALALGARLVGVNQRDLSTFEVDPGRAERLARRIPPDVVAVAESGVGGPDDARRLASAGYDAVLVGESAVTSSDCAAAVRALRDHPVSRRGSRAGHFAADAGHAGS